MRVVRNTGPLVSACQSQRIELLAALFDELHIPVGVMNELEQHQWSETVSNLPNLQIIELTADEPLRVREVSHQIEFHSRRRMSPELHRGEAEAIILAQRASSKYDAVLLDELAARTVARNIGLTVIGFGGVLVLAVDRGTLSPEELRECLNECRQQGTHYGDSLVESLFDEANRLWRLP